MMAVEYSAHKNSGILNQVIPGGRIVLIVTMKFRPVKIELNPRMNAPSVAATTTGFVCVL